MSLDNIMFRIPKYLPDWRDRSTEKDIRRLPFIQKVLFLSEAADKYETKKWAVRPVFSFSKRAHSTSPDRVKIPKPLIKGERRCQSLSSPSHLWKKTREQFLTTGLDGVDLHTFQLLMENEEYFVTGNELTMPQCILTKILRALATKKREFIKMRKNLITQQNVVLESYALLKDIEARLGNVSTEESLGEIRVLSVSEWPAHDLLLLVRDDIKLPIKNDINGIFGSQILKQIKTQLNPIPEDILSVYELMVRQFEVLKKVKQRSDKRSTYCSNMELKKNRIIEFDTETEKLQRIVADTAENIRSKINHALELAKLSWLDREKMARKLVSLHKDNMILQHQVDAFVEQENKRKEEQPPENVPNYETLAEELSKERAARESLKEIVAAAEEMLQVARARIATLERQIKDTRTELEDAKKKHRDLEQLLRHRDSSYDARAKKLIEVSKNGEVTIETLIRQRDALELRVKELREQTQLTEQTAQSRRAEQRSLLDSLQAKVVEQEKIKAASDKRMQDLENKINELEEKLQAYKERSSKLVNVERQHCLEFLPSKECEPTNRETEIWKELQVTRVTLARVEEELSQSRADKDSFLDSLSRIAQGEDSVDMQKKIAMELLDKEKTIVKLQRTIEELRENEKSMEQSMTQYENQLAALRLEVIRLRNYDFHSKDFTHQELQTELLELHMQVNTLTRERSSLVTAAASRALMLERHERSADLFARMIRTRRELCSLLDGNSTPPIMDSATRVEMSKSLSSVCASAAETWTALRTERARGSRLESAVLAQSLQLEREAQVRTQLERRRAMLEREVLRIHHSAASDPSVMANKNPNYAGRLWL